MTLAEAKDLAAIAGFIVGAGSLAFACYNTVLAFRMNRARFWLDLRSAFSRHDEVHQKLRPGGEWSDNSGPNHAEDMSKVEAYMGLCEHCEIMLRTYSTEPTFWNLLLARSAPDRSEVRAKHAPPRHATSKPPSDLGSRVA
jgi:hypothetical protein